MGFALGDAVRLRPGSDLADLLVEAADLTGTVGSVEAVPDGERISVLYDPVKLYATGLPAGEFVPDVALGAAPF